MNKNHADCIEIASRVFKIPVFLVDNNKNILFESTNKILINPCYLNKKDLFFSSLNYLESELTNPIIQTTIYLEKFIILPVSNNGIYLGNLIIGPYLYSNVSEKKIQGFSNDTKNQSRKKVFKLYHGR